MLPAITLGIALGGLVVLIGALPPLFKAFQQLSLADLRISWYLLAGLIIVLLPLHTSALLELYHHPGNWGGLHQATILLLGAGLARLAASLTLQSTLDIRRVTLLEQESITDPLTGVYNRRYLDRRLDEEFERAQRYRMPLSILLIDIDHFKQVNDKHGHQTGDLVLRYLGRLLLDAMRSSDIVARYGGEEFLIIAPNTSGHTAQGLAERLREHINSHKLVLSNNPSQRQEISVTASIGVADLDERTDTFEQFLNIADQALYQAKLDGRNRVISNRIEKKAMRPIAVPSN